MAFISELVVRETAAIETLPWYLWLLVAVATAGIPALTAAAIYRGPAPRGGARRVAWGVGGVWTLWIAVSTALAGAGIYRQSATEIQPWIAIVAGGALAVALLGARIPAIRRALADPGALARLTLPHTMRVAGVAFIIVMALGKLPAVFALPAGLGDIAVGISAAIIARRLAHGDRRGAVWFNALGLLDLVVAVSLGFLAGLGPIRLLDVSPSTAAVGLLPLALIPTSAVPLAVGLHIVSLTRLRAARSIAASQAALASAS